MFAGYTIGEIPLVDPRADDYLLTLGRAVHISTAFEAKSRHLVTQLRTLEGVGPLFVEVTSLDDLFGVRSVSEAERRYDPEELRLKEAAVRARTARQPLAHVLDRLHEEVYGDSDGIEKLKDARVGRNWIAHNAGLVFLPSHKAWTEGNFLRSFRNAVLAVSGADAMVSQWTWIEPECWHSVGPPEVYSEVYPELVLTWVFEKIWDLLPMDDLPPWRPHPDGPHARLQEHLHDGF